MTSYPSILVEPGPIARLTLNRPDKRNPIGPATCGELIHALAALRDDAAVRVIVLTGAGPAFSAGGDLAAMGAMAAMGAGSTPGAVPPASLAELLMTLHEVGKPIIAMVNGHALAGGLGLAPAVPWHTQRDAIVEYGNWLAMLAGSLGKIGQDVILLAQTEVGEVLESTDASRGGSIGCAVKIQYSLFGLNSSACVVR